MYSWSGTQPYRDGDFEAGIVIHEYSHGLSTRLTGGPANSGCLGWGEAGGMGEGWGDALATLIRMHDANITTFSMGEWASGRAGGIRNYPYSRSKKVNPSTYSILDKGGYWGESRFCSLAPICHTSPAPGACLSAFDTWLAAFCQRAPYSQTAY